MSEAATKDNVNKSNGKKTMFRVLVSDKLNESGLEILKKCAEVDYKPGLDPEELKKTIKNYNALLIRSGTKVTKEVIEACSSDMKIIGRAGVGVDNVDLDAATEKGIIVVNSPEGNTVAAAEHTVSMMMSLARLIPPADISMKSGEWKRSSFLGFELYNKTLGVVGLGKIGSRVARTAKSLGMKIVAYDPFVAKEFAEKEGFELVEMDGIWERADVITFHIPKTKETANLVNKETLAKCKKGVRIVNCARGGIINEVDLAAAIESGQVAGAALDVFDEEPVKDSPVLKLGNKVVLTPHLGASTEEAQLNVALDVAEQIADVLSGGLPRSAVNLPAMRPEAIAEVKSFMNFAVQLGIIVRQLSDGKTKEILIESNGELAKKNTTPLTVAVLKGILSCSVEGINYVNAPRVAKLREINIIEAKSETAGEYVEELKITLKTDKGQKVIAGTVLHNKIPAIIQLDDYTMSATPADHMLFTNHKDQPGMIAQVSTILWKDNINVSSMHVGREGPRGTSVMILNLDEVVSEDTLKKVCGIEGIQDARYVKLCSE